MIGSVLVCAFGRPMLSANGTPSRPRTSIGTLRAFPELSISARCRRTYVSAAALTSRQTLLGGQQRRCRARCQPGCQRRGSRSR